MAGSTPASDLGARQLRTSLGCSHVTTEARVEGANSSDPRKEPLSSISPSLIFHGSQEHGIPGARKPSPALLDSLGNPWKDAGTRNRPDSGGWEWWRRSG
jgi:hypothetical protein